MELADLGGASYGHCAKGAQKILTQLFDDQEDLPIDSKGVGPLVEAVLALEGKIASEVSVSFVGPDEICALHEEYFGDPSLTDCISFPMDEPGSDDAVLGDVVICPRVAVDDDGDAYHEVTLYLVHGLLHLLGYRDGTDEERLVMRVAEERHMKNLQERGLWLRC